MLDLPVPELLKLPVLRTAQVAKVLNMSTSQFSSLVKKKQLPLKPLPHSNKVKFWAASDLKQIITGKNSPSDAQSETEELLRAFDGQA